MLPPDHNPSPTLNAENAMDANTREGSRGTTLLGSPPDFELTPQRFALLLGLFIVASYPQVVFCLQTFTFRDYGLFGYPLALYHRECFWRGEIPLWNPLNNCGLPFLAQWNTMTLYPGSLVYLLLPLPLSLGLFCLVHLFLAGLGMFYLARCWTGSSVGAALAGVIFAFNGLTLNCLMWPNNIAGLGWMPWVVLATQRAWQQGGIRVIQAALVGAMQMLTGAPEIFVFTWLVVAALLLEDLWNSHRFAWIAGAHNLLRRPPGFNRARSAWRIGWRFLATALLVLGLCAIQLIPFLDLLLHSQRDRQFVDAGWAMPGWGWANFLVPLFHGIKTTETVVLQPDQGWTSSYYLGMAPWLLGLGAAWCVRRRRVLWLSLLAGVCLVMALGDSGYLYYWLRQTLPFLNLVRFPIKYVILVTFIAPLLAAYGAAWLGSLPAASSKRIAWTLLAGWGVAVGLIVGILWFARHYPYPKDNWPLTLQSGWLRALFLAWLAVALWLWHRAGHRGGAIIWVLALLCLHWADIATHAPNQNPVTPPHIYEAGLAHQGMTSPPSPGQSRAMISLDANLQLAHIMVADPGTNLLCNRLGMSANCNIYDNIPKINGFYSLYLREENEMRTRLYDRTNHYPAPLMDFLGVSYITARGQVFEWQSRTQAMPLATAGQQPVFAKEDATLRAIVSPQFQPRKEVYLPPEIKPFVTVSKPAKATLLAQRWQAHRIELDVEAAAPSLVVIAQAFYHPWKAYVDGSKVPLWRANHAFQALEVPAGQHRVQLRYEDGGFKTGLWVSGVTLAGCGLGWYRRRRRSQRRESL